MSTCIRTGETLSLSQSPVWAVMPFGLRQQGSLADVHCQLSVFVECLISPTSKVLDECHEEKSRQFCFPLGLGNNTFT